MEVTMDDGRSLCLRALLAACLVFVAVTKIVGDHRDGSMVSWGIYWTSCILELLTAVVLVTRWWRVAAWLTTTAVLGSLFVWWFGGGGSESCGCLGGLEAYDPRIVPIAASILGLLSVLALRPATIVQRV
jgi:hypothetical protein